MKLRLGHFVSDGSKNYTETIIRRIFRQKVKNDEVMYIVITKLSPCFQFYYMKPKKLFRKFT